MAASPPEYTSEQLAEMAKIDEIFDDEDRHARLILFVREQFELNQPVFSQPMEYLMIFDAILAKGDFAAASELYDIFRLHKVIPDGATNNCLKAQIDSKLEDKISPECLN